MKLGMIWAQAHGRVIGRDNDMPWPLPEDLAFFRRTTAQSPVIMGRKAWLALPDHARPLPGRRNIVLTRNQDFTAAGAEVAHDLDTALGLVADEPAWIIGGEQIYEQAMDNADVLVVTEIDATFDGDRYAPEIGPEWRVVSSDPAEGWATAANGLRYRMLRYERA